MILEPRKRPAGVTALSIFFMAGSLICFIATLSLLLPKSFVEPMWQLNPRARAGFAVMGQWAIVLVVYGRRLLCGSGDRAVARIALRSQNRLWPHCN
jgi:hypothetical protein